jgi:hypothetical protein
MPAKDRKDQDRSDEAELDRVRQLAENLGLGFDTLVRSGSERNMIGLQSENLLFSRRLDSRTFFVQDARFGPGRPAGSFEGDDDVFIAESRQVLERLEVPVDEIDEQRVLVEQTQVAEAGAEGTPTIGASQAGRRLGRFSRRVDGLPIWSSHLLLGLTAERQLGFLQLHWPEIPAAVLDETRKLAFLVREGWQPPEVPGARVESVEAGVTHSPAMGFIMDIYPAIRVIYEPVDPAFGRKATHYFDRHGSDVPVPRQFDLPPDEPAKRPEEGMPGVAPEEGRLREQFRGLLLSNPNYFGTLKESELTPVFPIQQNTGFEELVCVGYQPQLHRLEAVVHVKQSTGYGGDICSAGTTEFVRFFLSFDGGATWQDQGMASFQAYDVPGDKPLEYDLTLTINPPASFCFFENLPIVRSILSWNNPPTPGDPTFSPIWGNVREDRIQVQPRSFFPFGDLLSEAKLELPEPLKPLVDPGQPIALAEAAPLTPSELHALYAQADVPGHRYLSPALQQLIAQPHVPAFGPELTTTGLFGGLQLDLAEIISNLFATDGDTSFEELHCVGLNPTPTDQALVGTITVKLANGYSGGLCTAGSQEYVAFWIDTGSGWSHLGTTSVTVHDVGSIPPGGLQYAVFLPVDLSSLRQPCEAGPRTAKIRATLSWQTPPPPGNPNFVPTWGNREETLILIPAGPKVGDAQVPFLSAAGDIPESQIGATGKANGSAIHTGFVASDSPFGGLITIAGHISNPVPGLKYRVMRKPHSAPDNFYAPLTNAPLDLILNTFDGVSWHQTPSTIMPDGLGYYAYEDYAANHSVEGDLMARWFSNVAEDGLTFDLRIDLNTDGNPLNDSHSNVVTILVDNTVPVAVLDIDLGAGVQCADFAESAVFTGHFTATDLHFGGYSFEIQPSGPPNFPSHGVLPTPASGSSIHLGGAVTDPGLSGEIYTLDAAGSPPATGPMDPCGYALILHVSDRTNVNSGMHSHTNQASVGFCLRAPEA